MTAALDVGERSAARPGRRTIVMFLHLQPTTRPAKTVVALWHQRLYVPAISPLLFGVYV